MHDIVTIAAFQKVGSADLTRIGQLARGAMTDQTRQMLKRGLAWADFTFTFANGGYVVNVGVGDLWKDGGQYRTLAATPVDLVALAPPSEGLKRIVSIVAFANPARDEAAENREFAVLVTPATPTAPATYQTETRSQTILNRQIASISKVAGDLAPQPTAPVLSSDVCEIARVVLTRSGIDSVTPNLDTLVPNLGDVSARVDGVVDFVDGQGRRLDTLDKNLAALAARTPTAVSDVVLRQYAQNLAALNAATKLKAGDLDYGIEYGLDLSLTDNSYAGYAAYVGDGIRFPWVSSKEVPLTLFTPNDPVTKISGGLMLPAFTEEPRLVVEGMDGTLSIVNQVVTTINAVQVQIPRVSVREGPSFIYCTNSAFWATGQYDAVNQIFTRAGETFEVTQIQPGAVPGGQHDWAHITQIWVDKWTETRWDYVPVQIGLNGAVRGQTFRVPDFGWLSSFELPFTTVDTGYGVTLLLCETRSDGTPNLNRVLERADIAAGVAVADAKGAVRTRLTLNRPAYVTPGKLYAWCTVTRGNFALATVQGNKFAEGSSFITTDGGAFFAGSIDVDFAFTANFARFASPRVEIRLNDVDNVNGDPISAMKHLYGSVIPPSCRIIHMAKKAGGDWVALAEVNNEKTPQPTVVGGPFSSAPLPVSVQQKLVLLGTTTLMPAIDLNQAWVTALRLGTVRNHVTPLLTLKTACNRVEVEVITGAFDPVNHTTGCQLIVGGATVTPTSTSFVDDPTTPGRRIYTYGFVLGAATTQLRIVLPGTLASNLSPNFIERRFFRAWLV